MADEKALVPLERVESRILVIRGQKVIVDSDLAELYEVTTTRLNEQLRRNMDRFPPDFAFQLTQKEFRNLMSQSATSSRWGGRRKLPYAFTEHGAIMAASVLNSARAVEVSIFVVRAFVRLREVIASHKELARKLEELERKLATHDEQILMLLGAIRQLATPPKPGKRGRSGFAPRDEEGRAKP
ncbi:MAG: ORF6N domain-containing protein [Verrucomicrobia bacterium]|nr:ORF6N domain-containing protein [Verrucomicrobiota bacterium]